MTRSRIAALLALTLSLIAPSAQGQVRGTVPPRPTPGPEKPFAFPKVTYETLPNGLLLAVLENHEVPLVSVKIGSFAGNGVDPVGKEGGWVLMTSALRQGTTTRSAAQIADTLDLLGTSVAWGQTATAPIPQYTTAKAVWQPVLDIVADMLMNPSFPAEAVIRLQAAQAPQLRPNQSNLPTQALYRLVFGAGHPSARFASEASVRGLTRDDLVMLQTKFLRPQNTFIVVGGDVTPASARAAVMKSFAGWKSTGDTVHLAGPPPTEAPKPTAIYLIDFPGAAQATIAAMEPLPPTSSPDADGLELINAVLGGQSTSFGSRMYDVFRVKHGLSYAPASFLIWRPDPQRGAWQQAATVAPEKADSAMVFLAQIIRELHGERPITPAELDFAKSSLTRRLPVTMETVNQATQAVFQMMLYRRPTDYLSGFNARVDRSTLDEVRAIAARYFDPDHLAMVVCGDRAKLEPVLRATGIPVVIVDR